MKILILLFCMMSMTKVFAQDQQAMPTEEHGKHHGHGKHHEHGKQHGHGKHHGHMPHDFNHPEKWVDILNDPKRDEWQQPKVVVDQLQLKPTDIIGDLGTGAGYFIPHLLEKIPQGKLYAMDVADRLLAHIDAQMKEKGITQVSTIWISEDDLKLPAQTLDKLLIVNTWHHLPQNATYINRVMDLVKKDGALYLVEFTMEAQQGPPKEHRITAEDLIAQFQKEGYVAQLLATKLPQQYMVMVTKKSDHNQIEVK